MGWTGKLAAMLGKQSVVAFATDAVRFNVGVAVDDDILFATLCARTPKKS